ncbi:MAG: ASKHA domain-containing protein [Lachnospiraceae bacterium]|nr:ASKHA domain-containing protein [Lachnospiraceae bacterium]
MKKGTKCTICTGCGRCFGSDPVKIISYSGTGEHHGRVLPYPVICADIGTTTIAMICCDEKGRVLDHYSVLNPQGRYGADVLSRIGAASDPAAAGVMRDLVMDVLKTGALRFAEHNAGCMYISANTTMSYLLMGYETAELGSAPFNASYIGGAEFELPAGEKGEKIKAVLLPGFSAFAGADIYAGILAADLCASGDYRLLCDLGTNGEIALGNKDHLYVTATAAGPAFEGGPCKGIWGADMIHFASVLLDEGIMDETGLLKDPYFDEGITIGSAKVTQESVRALQLAKGAMKAGIAILLDKAGISYPDVEKCVLAGGFGYHLDPKDAANIGLLPAQLIPVCESGGNTALKGALEYAFLRSSRQSDDMCADNAGSLPLPPYRVINLAEEDAFNDLYMSSLNFENI